MIIRGTIGGDHEKPLTKALGSLKKLSFPFGFTKTLPQMKVTFQLIGGPGEPPPDIEMPVLPEVNHLVHLEDGSEWTVIAVRYKLSGTSVKIIVDLASGDLTRD